jgi:hypothetical protein
VGRFRPRFGRIVKRGRPAREGAARYTSDPGDVEIWSYYLSKRPDPRRYGAKAAAEKAVMERFGIDRTTLQRKLGKFPKVTEVPPGETRGGAMSARTIAALNAATKDEIKSAIRDAIAARKLNRRQGAALARLDLPDVLDLLNRLSRSAK